MRFGRLLASMCVLGIAATMGWADARDTGSARPWTDLESIPEAVRSLPETARPTTGRVFRLDVPSLAAMLAKAPVSSINEVNRVLVGVRVDQSDMIIEIPDPDGGTERFRIVESSVMHPMMQAKYPMIRTYIGQGVDRPAATLAMDLTPLGFHAQVLGPAPTRGVDRARVDMMGVYYVDPVSRGDQEHHVAYWHGTLPGDYSFECGTPGEGPNVANRPMTLRGPGPLNLRVLRIAIAATGEYTAYHSAPNPSNQVVGIAAIATCVSRMNQVFMRDLGVQFQLSVNNDALVYPNAATDPFVPSSGTSLTIADLQAQLPAVVAANIAAGAYDLGHVFHATSGGNGFAGDAFRVGSVCGADAAKGASTSGLPNGTYFWITLASHEIGHQIGGSHSFNGVNGSCGNSNPSQYTSASAIEPGSGVTIMSYGGNCGTDNVVTHTPVPTDGSLPQGGTLQMFNAYNIDQIGQVLAGTTCGFNVVTGNNRPFAPIVSPSVWTIPANTAFKLNCSAGDPDFGQQVTVSWEQYNIGAQRALGPDTGFNEPLFRTFDPSADPERTFPSLSTVLGGPALLGENLPIFNRSMLFRAVSRDNFAQGGGTNWAQATVNVVQTAGNQGFRVTSPASGAQFCAGQILAVQWNPVGTADAPVNAPLVDITLSLDGGQTWPITLLAGVANSGQAIMPVPAVNTSRARVKVEPTNNIFYAVNPGDITISAGPPSVVVQPNDLSSCPQPTPASLSLEQGPNTGAIQWFKDGAALSGETSPVLTFQTLSRNRTGDYHATITNACGQVSTRVARVQIGVSTEILAAPGGAVAACSPVTMSVRARGVGSLVIRWFRNGTMLTDSARFAGTTTATLTISGAQYIDEGTYSCRVSDICETVFSDELRLELPQPTWYEAPMNAAPPGQVSSEYWTGAFDENRNVFVLYGGSTQTGQTSNSLWEYDGNTWTVRQSGYPTLNTTGGQAQFDGLYPPTPSASAMVYNPDDRKVYLIAPFAWNRPLAIYTWDGTNWARPYYGPVNGDTGRTHAVYDRMNHRIVIVRGVGGSNNSEMLIYDPATNVMTGPVAMQPQVQIGVADSALWYDQYRRSVIWYNNINVFVQPTMWVLGPNDQWVQLQQNPVRLAYASRIVYDPVRYQAVAMGGEVSSGNYYTGTVVWPGLRVPAWTPSLAPADDWAGVLPNGAPASPLGAGVSPPSNWTPAFWSGMVFDTRRRAMVAAGRQVNANPFGYTWRTYERRYLDVPMLDVQPPPSVAASGQTLVVTAKSAGAATLTRRWTRNNVVLSDGPLAGAPGTTISGATTDTLTVVGPGATQAAAYRLQVNNGCGAVVSNAAIVGSPIVSDFDGDGVVAVQDIFDFLNAWFAGDPRADLNGDGVSIQDIFSFLNAWFMGI